METQDKAVIMIYVKISAPTEVVWKRWTCPEDILKWNQASDDWHTPRAINDLRDGGRFVFRMEAKDGSFGFDFSGIYDRVQPNNLINYTLDDGRKVTIVFQNNGNETTVIETFEAENANSIEQQRNGWQSILNNFKKYTEGSGF